MRDSGFRIYDDVFDRGEMSRTIGELSTARLDRTRAGARHVLNVPVVRALATEARMIAIARQFAGPAPVPFRATLFDKSRATNWLVVWHQDTALPLSRRFDAAGWGPWSIKAGASYAHAPAWALEQVIALRLSLDDSTALNGPLRLLPDTHLQGVLDDEKIERLARDTRPVDCLTGSGGVVAMRPLAIHASSKAVDDRPRRVLHIEYAPALCLAPGVELAIV